jgi:threonine dehydrogenase-like Zn-dependent dehydrogenase
MLAVTFQGPGDVRVEERPDPELLAPDDAIVRVRTTGASRSSPASPSGTSTSARSSRRATR